jgi:integrase
MPRLFLMTWNGRDGRAEWRKKAKKYSNTPFVVSTKQLREQGYDCDDTMEGSRIAANAWWRNRLFELEEAARQEVRPPSLKERLALSCLEKNADDWPDTVKMYGDLDKASSVYEKVANLVVAKLLHEGKLPEPCQKNFPPEKVRELEKAARILRLEEAPQDTTLGGQIQAYLVEENKRSQAGQITRKTLDNRRLFLGYFRDHVGATAEARTVSAETLPSFHMDYCLPRLKTAGGPWTTSTADKIMKTVKQFIGWMAERGACSLPPNFHKRFPFKGEVSDSKELMWTVEEFQLFRGQLHLLGEDAERMELYLLLMANCGFTQKDIVDLHRKEVDFLSGRIIRRRSKSYHNDKTPKVNYLLWPTTAEMLRRQDTGRDWLLARRPEGLGRKHGEEENVRADFNRFRDRIGFPKPMKGIRKMAATIVEEVTGKESYSTYFLGHSPKTVKDINYVPPLQPRFDQAVLDLGRQLGQVPTV